MAKVEPFKNIDSLCGNICVLRPGGGGGTEGGGRDV